MYFFEVSTKTGEDQYGDWFFNLYERFKYDVRQTKANSRREPTRFQIGTLRIQGNRLILTDRQTKPLFNSAQLSLIRTRVRQEMERIFLRI